MAKVRVKEKLKSGQSITGKVIEVDDNTVTLELRDESRVKLPLPESVANEVENEFDDEIITILNDGGDYEIEEHEEWPKGKTKE